MKEIPKESTYVLITAARNEERYIEDTIKSVISQTVLPKKWVIVSDGSTDRTDEIVKGYMADYDWISFSRMPERRDRQFAAKVTCFNAGYETLSKIDYDVIGNLDADISFEKDYFEFLLDKFSKMPDLGVAGTPFVEEGYSSTDDSFEGEKHVAGGCQLFRRECFERIGGYVPIKGGGIDWVAVTSARMNGWRTLSFRERQFMHHRHLGTGGSNRIAAEFNYGKKDYFLGGHPLWEVFRCAYQLTRKPYLMKGLVIMSGYIWAGLNGTKRPISRELMDFHRKEQMYKLRLILHRTFRLRKTDKFDVAPL
jgi:glycosyltransferase involved in cell wall biosynthesis